uniref:RdRp n=1 Tax=Erysiphe necator associated mitovirus 7 TaxID=2691995 RepID=A0A7U3RCZ4_9VIRU|nr:RdRp [Erysiphe necator associated mitovirus 7]
MRKSFVKILWRLLQLNFPMIEVRPILGPYFKLIFNFLKNWNTLSTIKYLKQVRLHCTRYICGNPLYTNKMSIGLDKDGWPKIFYFLKPLVDSKRVPMLKFVMTILNFTRGWELSSSEWAKVKPNYEVVTSPSTCKHTIPSGVINSFVKDFKLKSVSPSFNKDKDIYLSSKAGPEGPATLTSMQSLLNYNYQTMQHIFNITDENGVNYFVDSYRYAFENKIVPKKLKTLGKISFIKDPEAKLRLVAISDYFTQLYLKPIHTNILNLLKKFECDRTFTQNPLHNWDTSENNFWSLDLSSATDRFPVKLQMRLLTRIYNQNLANSWHLLLQNREFMTPEGSVVNYATGQPMGTYSSWAVFTLCHHLVVYYCAHLNGIKNFNQYMILGDDIVIHNDKVAESYKKIIRELGVELSDNKTHVSNDTYEFAKRWIKPLQNVEITGLPLKGILSNWKNPFIVFTIIYDYYKIKGNLFMSNYSLVMMVKRFYHKLLIGKQNHSLSKSTYNKLKNFSLALDINFNFISYDKIRLLFCQKCKNDIYMIPTEGVALLEYRRILSDGLASVVAKFNNGIINNPKMLLNKFEIEDKNILRFFPVFVAVRNVINVTWNKVKQWDSSESLMLHDISKDLNDLSIDNIFNKDRNKIQSLLSIGKILNTGFKKLNSTDEIYYGSSWATSTYTISNDLARQSQKLFANDLLENVMNGKYEKELTHEERAERTRLMWENFMK